MVHRTLDFLLWPFYYSLLDVAVKKVYPNIRKAFIKEHNQRRSSSNVNVLVESFFYIIDSSTYRKFYFPVALRHNF